MCFQNVSHSTSVISNKAFTQTGVSVSEMNSFEIRALKFGAKEILADSERLHQLYTSYDTSTTKSSDCDPDFKYLCDNLVSVKDPGLVSILPCLFVLATSYYTILYNTIPCTVLTLKICGWM